MVNPIKIPDDYWKPNSKTVFGGLVSFGGLIGGIYLGLNNAKGIPVAENVELMLKFAPATLCGIVGLSFGSKMSGDSRIQSQMRDRMNEQIRQAPFEISDQQRQAMEGCGRGCGVIGVGIGGFVGGGLMTLIGYGIGYWLGSQA